jgi:hypothetical protein
MLAPHPRLAVCQFERLLEIERFRLDDRFAPAVVALPTLHHLGVEQARSFFRLARLCISHLIVVDEREIEPRIGVIGIQLRRQLQVG